MASAPKLMTADEFLIWRQSQEGTWEFVDGAPRRKFHNPLNMMAGGTVNHALVAANVIAALRPRLRGSGCRPTGSDLAVRNLRGGLRQPDVLVQCGTVSGHDLQAREPKVVFEVLSPSTRGVDLIRKAEEYRQLPSLAHLVILEADLARSLVWTRIGDGWEVEEVAGREGLIRLTGVGADLPLSEVYEDVELQPE